MSKYINKFIEWANDGVGCQSVDNLIALINEVEQSAKEIDLYEVVIKLSGPINPVGETNADNRRLENLKSVIKLTENLLNLIYDVAQNKTCPEYSRKVAGEKANNYLKNLKDWLNEDEI